MRKWLVVIAHGTFWMMCAFWAAAAAGAAQIPNHKATVIAARAAYAALSGPQRAYCIVNKVAWDLSGEGAGSFFKSSGSAYLQRSQDIVIYKPKGETFDVLGDAEGNANPQWGRTSPTGFGDVAKWRAAINPVGMAACPTGSVTPPDPPDPPDPPPSDDLTARVKALEVQVAQQAQRLQALETQAASHGTAIADLDRRTTALALKPPVCTPGEQSTSRGGWPAHGHTVWTCIPTVAVP